MKTRDSSYKQKISTFVSTPRSRSNSTTMRVKTLAAVMAVISLMRKASSQYGPDPAGVPEQFLCGWRMLAFNASTSIRPDAGRLISDALELEKYCKTAPPASLLNPSKANKALKTAPTLLMASSEDAFTVYVSVDGQDSWPGTAAKPKRTIQAGIDATRNSKASAAGRARRVVINGGTYFLREPIKLMEGDDFLTSWCFLLLSP